MKHLAPYCALLVVAAQVAAQGSPSRLAVDDLLVPVHTQDADPTGGSYGTWAAGPAYKASFHDGFAFYPVLGKAYPRNLPLRWKTESVTADGTELLTPGRTPGVTQGNLRIATSHGAVVEAYEVRKDGVEQSFVIAQRPATPGAIVVRGRIETELVAKRAEGHVAIDFQDAQGHALVRYGEAFAIDAAGKKADVVTGWDGEHLTLTVPAAFAAEAAYPLTIDPLTTSILVSSGSDVVGDVAVCSIPVLSTTNTLVASTRYSSASDLDLFVVSTNVSFLYPTPVYSDVETTWSTANPSLAAGEGASRWIVAFQRDFANPTQSATRAYVHDVGDTTLNSGSTLAVNLNVSNTHRNPQVGGSTGSLGKKALVVWQTDTTTTQANTASTAVWGRVVDLATKTFATGSFALGTNASSSLDREFPCVSRMAAEDGSWVVGWQQYDNSIANDDWDVLGNRVTQAGVVFGSDSDLAAGKATGHSIRPKIAGQAGRYLIAWTDASSFSAAGGNHVYARRFAYADNNTGPTYMQPIRSVETLLPGFGTLVLGGVAYDTNSMSHWAVQYRHQQPGVVGSVRVHRVGGSGGNVEKAVAFTNDGTPLVSDVGFHGGNNGSYFQVVFNVNAIGNGVYGERLEYNGANTVAYNVGCGGQLSLMIPDAGNELYATGITNIKPSVPAVLMLSANQLQLSLASLGMPGCYLNVNTSSYVALSTMSNASGGARIDLPLPDYPVALTGDVYSQWVWLAPGANTLGVLASQGAKHMIR